MKKKTCFVQTLDQFRRLEVRKKARNVFAMSLRLSDHKPLTQHCIFIKFFRFRLYFVFPRFGSLRNLIKQLFHSRLLDMRLVIANSALRALLAI